MIENLALFYAETKTVDFEVLFVLAISIHTYIRPLSINCTGI